MKTYKMCIQQHHYFSVVKFKTCNRENDTEGWYNLCLSRLKRCDLMSNQSSLTSSRVPVVIGRGVRQINKFISNEWHCHISNIRYYYYYFLEHTSKQHGGSSASYLSSPAVGRSWCCRPVTWMAWDEGRSQQRASPWPNTGPSWPALPRHTSLCTAARQSSPLATPLNSFHPVEHNDCPAQRTWDQGDECHSAGDGGWGGGWGCG